MKRLIIFWIKAGLFTALIVTPVLLFAQGPGFDDDVEDTPIDGGATILLATAVGYGYKKLKDKSKKDVD